MHEFLASGRTNAAARAVGAAQGALDLALEYTIERELFDELISEFQAIQHKLAEIATKILLFPKVPPPASRSLNLRIQVGEEI